MTRSDGAEIDLAWGLAIFGFLIAAAGVFLHGESDREDEDFYVRYMNKMSRIFVQMGLGCVIVSILGMAVIALTG